MELVIIQFPNVIAVVDCTQIPIILCTASIDWIYDHE